MSIQKLSSSPTSGVNLVWKLGVVDPGQQSFDFSRQISKKFRFVQAILQKISIFSKQILKKFRFLQAILKKINFSSKNWSFTATSSQIILLLFKSHHFRTYFLYKIRYNNISRPVHGRPPATPYDAPAQNRGSRPPTLKIDAPEPHDLLIANPYIYP